MSASDASGDGGRNLHVVGIVVTIGVHGLVLAALIGMNHLDTGHAQKRASLADEQVTTIEAGLAFKSKTSKGKKSRLPRKDVAPKVKPPEGFRPASSDAPAPSKDDPAAPDDKQDARSTFDKFRDVDTGEQVGSNDGADDATQAGADDGSEFGTIEKAKGDPYVGELIGRMITDFVIPSTVEPGQTAWGCVQLDASGKIVDRKLDPDHKSTSHAYNSAVEERLEKTTDMEAPVPAHLKPLLVDQFACVIFPKS